MCQWSPVAKGLVRLGIKRSRVEVTDTSHMTNNSGPPPILIGRQDISFRMKFPVYTSHNRLFIHLLNVQIIYDSQIVITQVHVFDPTLPPDSPEGIYYISCS